MALNSSLDSVDLLFWLKIKNTKDYRASNKIDLFYPQLYNTSDFLK